MPKRIRSEPTCCTAYSMMPPNSEAEDDVSAQMFRCLDMAMALIWCAGFLSTLCPMCALHAEHRLRSGQTGGNKRGAGGHQMVQSSS